MIIYPPVPEEVELFGPDWESLESSVPESCDLKLWLDPESKALSVWEDGE